MSIVTDFSEKNLSKKIRLIFFVVDNRHKLPILQRACENSCFLTDRDFEDTGSRVSTLNTVVMSHSLLVQLYEMQVEDYSKMSHRLIFLEKFISKFKRTN